MVTGMQRYHNLLSMVHVYDIDVVINIPQNLMFNERKQI